MNPTFLEKVQCILSNTQLCKELWAKILLYTSHLIYRLPVAANKEKTPLEVWCGYSTIDYGYIFLFALFRESKFDLRAKKVIFLDFSIGLK